MKNWPAPVVITASGCGACVDGSEGAGAGESAVELDSRVVADGAVAARAEGISKDTSTGSSVLEWRHRFNSTKCIA